MPEEGLVLPEGATGPTEVVKTVPEAKYTNRRINE